MTGKKFLLYGFLTLLAAGVFYYRPYLENYYLLSKGFIQDSVNGIGSQVQEAAKKNISAPPPLKSEKKTAGAELSSKGVIRITNAEREKSGKKSLEENAKLDAAAKKKAEDILAKQYFDHVSPEGNGPDYFVSSAGYEYITIGENLALGNFSGDQDLVDAWMASPGHRENILRSQFEEIGVAVVKGTYEGKSVWVSVQEFGTPLSACPTADASLKKVIDSNTKKIDALSAELKKLKAEIDDLGPRSSSYNQKVEEYNSLAGEYNSLVSKTKTVIEKYNSQVKNYNSCLEKYK